MPALQSQLRTPKHPRQALDGMDAVFLETKEQGCAGFIAYQAPNPSKRQLWVYCLLKTPSHKSSSDVLRDIDLLAERGVPNFGETPYINLQNGQTYRAFEMDRDGFTLLAMSFTGDRALDAEVRVADEKPD